MVGSEVEKPEFEQEPRHRLTAGGRSNGGVWQFMLAKSVERRTLR
jgi:hypothetical protein